MTTDNKTLADVQPGGRVRLGDQASAQGCDELRMRTDGERAAYLEGVAEGRRAVLSAQPSPGGQEVLETVEELAELNRTCAALDPDYKGPTDAAVQAVITALAARQPVGEPVGEKLMRLLRERAALPESVELSYQRDGDGTGRAWWDRRHAELEAQGYSLDFETDSGAEWYTLRGIGDELRAALAEYDTAPPAQAVDLGQFREPIAAWSKHCAHSVKGYESYQDSDLPDWMAERRQQVRKCGELLALIDSHTAGGQP